MDELETLGREYRETAARLALKLRQMQAAGAERWRVAMLETMLRETRETARTVSHYYDTPRDPGLTSAGLYAKKVTSRDSG